MELNLKQVAAAKAVEYVQSGMVLGLGTGSTTRYATEMIGERIRDGRLHDIVGVPTSSATEKLAKEVGIPLTTLKDHPGLDLTIDGADEVDPDLTLIKGLGGALLYEKIVARASRQEIIIVDESKLVQVLGTRSPLPVEVIPFGWGTYMDALRRFGCEPALRLLGTQPYVTDEGNYILDCFYDGIDLPRELTVSIHMIPGVVEDGLFLGLARTVVVASLDQVRVLER